MTLPKNQLTEAEAQRRAELEAIIKPGIVDSFKVGAALREMCDSRLYRNTHSTFKLYVEETYATGARTAYELMDHADTVKALPPECAKFAQTANPAQTRQLKKVPAEKRAQVIEAAQSKAAGENRKVTAADVRVEAAKVEEPNEIIPPRPPAPAYDILRREAELAVALCMLAPAVKALAVQLDEHQAELKDIRDVAQRMGRFAGQLNELIDAKEGQ